jgi:hypothetical protein
LAARGPNGFEEISQNYAAQSAVVREAAAQLATAIGDLTPLHVEARGVAAGLHGVSPADLVVDERVDQWRSLAESIAQTDPVPPHLSQRAIERRTSMSDAGKEFARKLLGEPKGVTASTDAQPEEEQATESPEEPAKSDEQTEPTQSVNATEIELLFGPSQKRAANRQFIESIHATKDA